MVDIKLPHHHSQNIDKLLIVSRRDGKEVYYKLADTEQAQIVHHVCEEMFRISCPFG